MAWDGYLAFAGNEIINVARTEAYAKSDGSPWFRALYRIPELAYVLGEARAYTSPIADLDCPWLDRNDADSYGFYGLYPTNIDGVESSSRISTPVEYTTDGGNPGILRHGSKSIVVSGVLIGQDDGAVDYGMRWLRNALLGDCNEIGCVGSEVCYLYSEPVWDGTQDEGCGDDYLRTLRNTICNSGPTLMSKHRLSDGAAAWEVQFTLTAGNPFEYGAEQRIVTHMFSSDVVADAGGWIETGSRLVPEVTCPGTTFTPVVDPSCPNLITPPTAPQIALSCFDPPKNWRRRSFQVPADVVPAWTEMVPVISIAVGSADLRNLRLRLYSDPNEDFDVDSNPCAYCADILVTYAPANSLMILDGRDQTVMVTSSGQTRRADGLVLQSNGQPLSWPALSCGIAYQVACDIPQSNAGRYHFDFSLVPRNR